MCADEACFGLVASSFQFFTRLTAVFAEEALWSTAGALDVLTAYWPRAFSGTFEVGLDGVNLFVS